jgi:two-component system response regulator FixJ
MPTTSAVYVIVDEPAVCKSLQRLLDTADLRSHCFNSVTTFLGRMPELTDGCILLDDAAPELDCIELLTRIRQVNGSFPVILMIAQAGVGFEVKAVNAGAFNCIEKPFSDDTLFAAIHSALSKRDAVSETKEAEDAVRQIAALSPRERQVLSALMLGHSNKDVAVDLGISLRTVEIHRARMMERLGVQHLSQAVLIAAKAKLVLHRTEGR